MLFEVVADLWPDLLSCVGCRADRLKDEFFAEIFATHPAVAVLNDAEDRKEVEQPHHSVHGKSKRAREGEVFLHSSTADTLPHTSASVYRHRLISIPVAGSKFLWKAKFLWRPSSCGEFPEV